jgi:hypothetical protein
MRRFCLAAMIDIACLILKERIPDAISYQADQHIAAAAQNLSYVACPFRKETASSLTSHAVTAT